MSVALHLHSSAAPSSVREQAILEYYPLVRTIAGRLARRLPPNVDADELVNTGVLGLIDAIDRFDPTRGVPFKAYAEIRIQGAMVDSLRHDDFVPRSVRRKANRIEAARATLSRSLGRDATREEMAAELGTSVGGYEAMAADATIRKVLSFDAPTSEDDDGQGLHELLAAEVDGADSRIFDTQVRARVAEAVGLLPEKERVAVSLYYVKGLTLREIGEVLGVTESRACQLRGEGVKRLRFRLRELVD